MYYQQNNNSKPNNISHSNTWRTQLLVQEKSFSIYHPKNKLNVNRTFAVTAILKPVYLF